MVYKKKIEKKPKRTIDEEYGPEEGFEEEEEEEEEEFVEDEKETKKFKKKKEKYEVFHRPEVLGIMDTTKEEPLIVKTNTHFTENDMNAMLLEVKKLNDIEDIKKVVM